MTRSLAEATAQNEARLLLKMAVNLCREKGVSRNDKEVFQNWVAFLVEMGST